MDDSKKLQEFLNRMANDSDFEKRVKEDKNVLAELGWSPEAISGFQVERSDADVADTYGWNCGADCGCVPMGLGKGSGPVCYAGHGS